MSAIDPTRISKTIAYLLRHKPEHGNLHPDDEGWVPLDQLSGAVSRLLRARVDTDRIRAVLEESQIRRFEITADRIRAVKRARGRTGPSRSRVPDILYYAVLPGALEAAQATGAFETGARPLYLSEDEAPAWRVVHRIADAGATVVVVDAARAARGGVRFTRNARSGLFQADRIPLSDVISLRPNFAVQLSAGGFPLVRDAHGAPRLALVSVTRRRGVTWEVAKGKLEPGETPEATAEREVREELGVEPDVSFEVLRSIGEVRYGFMAPGGLPRLKRVFLYFLRPNRATTIFAPPAREGIGEVRWFTPDDAARVVRHSSLKPLMRRVVDLLQSGTIDLESLPRLDVDAVEPPSPET